MKRKLTAVLSVTLSLLMLFSSFAFAAEETKDKDYTIVSPYEEVIWKGENAWQSYKGNLHTHSTVSDASTDYRDMIMEYYNQGFDFLAMTDHAVTGKAWNEKPTELPLYLYQKVIGNFNHYLSDEEYEAVTTGTYPVNGTARGYGMTCLVGGNELNGLTVSKSHVNGMFLPAGVGDNYLGFENDYEGAVRLADNAGGLSFINHPGDWLNRSKEACTDPENVNYFADILLRYDSCLGMEVFNERNGPTPNDRWLWDCLLKTCLPYGKQVIAFSNGDTHELEKVDTSFMEFMMEENTVENIKKTMQSGAFFAITRVLGADDILGPKEHLDAANSGLAYPMFTEIKVEGHKITVEYTNAYNVQWVGNGEVIKSVDVDETSAPNTFTIDLDEYENAADMLYVRCQLLGKGGITLTQAFEIDNGAEDLTYEQDNSPEAVLKRIVRAFLSLRIFVIVKILARKIG